MRYYRPEDFACFAHPRGVAIRDPDTGRYVSYLGTVSYFGTLAMAEDFRKRTAYERNEPLWDAAFDALRVGIIFACGYQAGNDGITKPRRLKRRDAFDAAPRVPWGEK